MSCQEVKDRSESLSAEKCFAVLENREPGHEGNETEDTDGGFRFSSEL